jgi:hypothetical protein
MDTASGGVKAPLGRDTTREHASPPNHRKVVIMTESDLSHLRDRVEDGEGEAVDELIELATERGDMDELRRLADKGNTTAAEQLLELTAE